MRTNGLGGLVDQAAFNKSAYKVLTRNPENKKPRKIPRLSV